MSSRYPLDQPYQLESFYQLESIYLVIAIINAIFWATSGVGLLRGIKTMTILKDSGERYKPKEYPLLSVIIPACNSYPSISLSLFTGYMQNI